MNIVNLIKIFLILPLLILIFNGKLNSQIPVLLPGFPVILDTLPVTSDCAIVVADFNNDMKNEILFTNYIGGFRSNVYLIKSDGSILDHWPKIINGLSYSPTAGDLNGDGNINLILRTQDSIFVFDYLGQSLPGFPIGGFGGLNKTIALYDLNKDKKLEIITSVNNQIYIIKHDGSIMNGWPVSIPAIKSKQVFISLISVGDIDNDGVPEIIAPVSECNQGNCYNNEIYIFTPDGNKYSDPINSDSNYFFQFVAASIFNQNDSSYFIINSVKPEANDSVTTRTTIYDCNGNIKTRTYTTEWINTSGTISIGNIANSLKFSFGYQSFKTFLLNNDLSIFNGWPIQSNSFYIKPPLIFSLFGQKVIMTAENYATTIGGFSENHGFIRFFNINGFELNWSPIRPRGIPNSAILCDLNNDQQLDLITWCDFSISAQNNYGIILYAWTFPGVNYDHKNIDWSMHGHDRYRTFQYGFIPPDEPVGIQPMNTNIPQSFNLYQNFPNPFNPVTSIKFDITKRGDVKLVVFDMLGREVMNILNEKLNPGIYQVRFDGSELSSGVYFYRLEADNFIQTKKMLLLK